MKRLVVVLVVLAIVLIAVASEIKRNPDPNPQARVERMSGPERVKLEQAKHEFNSTRGRLRRMRDEGASKAEIQAQEKKLDTAAQKVAAIAGTEELRQLGEQGRATMYGRTQRQMRGGGRRGRSGAPGGGRRPGGPTREAAPAGSTSAPGRGK